MREWSVMRASLVVLLMVMLPSCSGAVADVGDGGEGVGPTTTTDAVATASPSAIPRPAATTRAATTRPATTTTRQSRPATTRRRSESRAWGSPTARCVVPRPTCVTTRRRARAACAPPRAEDRRHRVRAGPRRVPHGRHVRERRVRRNRHARRRLRVVARRRDGAVLRRAIRPHDERHQLRRVRHRVQRVERRVVPGRQRHLPVPRLRRERRVLVEVLLDVVHAVHVRRERLRGQLRLDLLPARHALRARQRHQRLLLLLIDAHEIVPHAVGFFFKKRHVFRFATTYAACSTRFVFGTGHMRRAIAASE